MVVFIIDESPGCFAIVLFCGEKRMTRSGSNSSENRFPLLAIFYYLPDRGQDHCVKGPAHVRAREKAGDPRAAWREVIGQSWVRDDTSRNPGQLEPGRY